MHSEAVKKCPFSLVYVLDHCVKLQAMWQKDYLNVMTVKPWHYDDKIIKSCNGYEQRKVPEPNLNEDLLRVG